MPVLVVAERGGCAGAGEATAAISRIAAAKPGVDG